MKDSGIPWIGEIPSSWAIEKMKGCLRRHDVKGHGDAMVLSLYRDHGVVPKDSRDDNHNRTGKDTNNYKYVRKGDLVINKMKAWQGSLSVSGYDGIVSPAYFVYEFCSDKLDKCYADYLLRFAYKQEFERVSGGIREGQWDLPAYDFERMPILLPPLSEQRCIVGYLDKRCGTIDEVKKTIEQEVDALRRLRSAMIFKTVTKGLDDSVSMQNSGIEWIGEIPATWKMAPNHAVFSGTKEIVGDRSDQYVLLSLTKQGVIERDVDGGGKFPSSFDTYQVVHPGQMIFCLFDIDETPRTVGLSTLKGMITGAYDVFDVNERVCDSRYALYYYLVVDEGKHLRPYYRSLRKTLTTTAFRHVKMPLPPVYEQHRIVNYLDERCALIDSVIDARTQQLERLEDYRKALIYAYTTGKKEVPAS